MSWLNEVGTLLDRYGQNSAPGIGTEVESHFGEVAKAAPPEELSSGITEAFRSDSTPPFANMVSQLFGVSNSNQKSGLVNTLLSALGPSASGILEKLGLSGINQGNTSQAVSLDPAKVQELAVQAEKKDPSVLERAGEFYAQHPGLVKNLGSAALAIVLARMAKNNRAM